MGMIHPRQFSSIFSSRHVSGTSSDPLSNGTGSLHQMTQFKLNSITDTKVNLFVISGNVFSYCFVLKETKYIQEENLKKVISFLYKT